MVGLGRGVVRYRPIKTKRWYVYLNEFASAENRKIYIQRLVVRFDLKYSSDNAYQIDDEKYRYLLRGRNVSEAEFNIRCEEVYSGLVGKLLD